MSCIWFPKWKGSLAEGKDAYDVIAATFPGGTITGAPKIRTMEIIEELEPKGADLTRVDGMD